MFKVIKKVTITLTLDFELFICKNSTNNTYSMNLKYLKLLKSFELQKFLESKHSTQR